MTFFKPRPTDLDELTESPVEASTVERSAVEGELRESVLRDVATPRPPPETDSEPVGGNIGTLLQRVAGSSIAEIDRLTSELHILRELLQSEGARVQREIIEYARLSRSAMQSTKIVHESLTKWKNADARERSG